jgi:hypothetical protein
MPSIDFAALRGEKDDFFIITPDGERIDFAKEIPADVILDLRNRSRKIDQNDEVAATEFFLEMGRRVIGDELNARLASELGLTELFKVIDELMIYYGVNERESDEGESEADESDADEGKDGAATDGNPTEETSGESRSMTLSTSTGQSNPTSNVFGLVPMPNSEPERSRGPDSSVG